MLKEKWHEVADKALKQLNLANNIATRFCLPFITSHPLELFALHQSHKLIVFFSDGEGNKDRP